jgi:hypothetical protein
MPLKNMLAVVLLQQSAKRLRKFADSFPLPPDPSEYGAPHVISASLSQCALCGKREAKYLEFPRCAGCHMALYCCKKHQKAHWPDHKSKCKPMRHRLWELKGKDVPAGEGSVSEAPASEIKDGMAGGAVEAASESKAAKKKRRKRRKKSKQPPETKDAAPADSGASAVESRTAAGNAEAASSDGESKGVCAQCGKADGSKQFTRCARCLAVCYCCLECQKAHWLGHKTACKPRQPDLES